MRLIFLLTTIAIFSGCTTAQFLSEKDAWIAIRSVGSDRIFYCERRQVKADMVPICIEATSIPAEFALKKYMESLKEQK